MPSFKSLLDIAFATRKKGNNAEATHIIYQNIKFGVLNMPGVQYHLLMGMITNTLDPKNEEHQTIINSPYARQTCGSFLKH